MPLAALLDFWKRDRDTAPNLVAWRTLPPRPAQTHPFPDDLPVPVKKTLIASGIHTLYSHQLEAWTHARAGGNIVLATGTASGKTLAYNLPVFASLLQDNTARALYLFPTKALAQDQLSTLERLNVQTCQLPFMMAIHHKKTVLPSAGTRGLCCPTPICSIQASCRITPTGATSSPTCASSSLTKCTPIAACSARMSPTSSAGSNVWQDSTARTRNLFWLPPPLAIPGNWQNISSKCQSI